MKNYFCIHDAVSTDCLNMLFMFCDIFILLVEIVDCISNNFNKKFITMCECLQRLISIGCSLKDAVF